MFQTFFFFVSATELKESAAVSDKDASLGFGKTSNQQQFLTTCTYKISNCLWNSRNSCCFCSLQLTVATQINIHLQLHGKFLHMTFKFSFFTHVYRFALNCELLKARQATTSTCKHAADKTSSSDVHQDV